MSLSAREGDPDLSNSVASSAFGHHPFAHHKYNELCSRLPATAVVNSDAAAQTEIAEMLLESGWELGAHGLNNSTGNAALSRDEEAAAIGETLNGCQQNCGTFAPTPCVHRLTQSS